MATHDYVIDNSTGANVRADINNVLQAILTNNSSSSAPSTTAAYMWWADTTNGVLKIRNSANNDWVELLQLDGTLTLEDGSATTPALAFRDDLNTGIYSSAADRFNISVGGVDRLEMRTDMVVFNETGTDTDFKVEGDNEANLFFVDAGNDRVGIATGTPSDVFEVTHSQNAAAGISISNTNNSQASAIAQLLLAGGDNAKARIKLEVGGVNHTIDEDSNNNLIFEESGSERMRLDNGGRLLLGTTTEGNESGDELTINSSANTGITLRTGSSANGSILFSDGTSGTAEYAGFVQYQHASDELVLGAATVSVVKIHDEHFNIFAPEGTSRVNLGFSNTSGAELSLYDDTGAQKTRICGSTNTDHFFNNGGDVAIGHSSPSCPLEVRRDNPSAGQMLALGSNGTHCTTNAGGVSNALTLFRVRVEVAPNTTTDLVSGYGGSLVLITMVNNGGDDVQQTRVRTHAWSTTSSLFFNTYGSNQPTVTFSVSSGVLKVNHNHTGNIFFNCAGFIITGPQSS